MTYYVIIGCLLELVTKMADLIENVRGIEVFYKEIKHWCVWAKAFIQNIIEKSGNHCKDLKYELKKYADVLVCVSFIHLVIQFTSQVN